MNKILTIVIPSYNVEKTLNRTLNSLINEKNLKDIEVIIVNDGSVDKTEQIGQYYTKKYPNVFKIINKKNGGHGSAINVGIQEATGKYFKILDGDDTVDKLGFNNLVTYLRNHKSVDAVFSPYYKYRFNINKKEFVGYFKGNFHFRDDKVINFDKVANYLEPSLHSLTYSTSLLKHSKIKMDEHCFYEDNEYSLMFFRDVKKVALLLKPVYVYWLGSEEQSMNLNTRFKRIDQSSKVIFTLVNFYEVNFLNKNKYVRTFIENKLTELIMVQYRLIIGLPNINNSYEQIRAFDKKLFSNSQQIYYSVLDKFDGDKITILLKFWRKHNWMGYKPISLIFRKKIQNSLKI